MGKAVKTITRNNITAEFYVSEFGDSMGYDSGTVIAEFTDNRNGRKFNITVVGDVDVDYDAIGAYDETGEGLGYATYYHASDMPKDLRDKFFRDFDDMDGIEDMEEDGRLIIKLNNWFSFCENGDSDDEVIEIGYDDDYESVFNLALDFIKDFEEWKPVPKAV